jgi:regulatory protein YycI of two-component signal transduction system YycFG
MENLFIILLEIRNVFLGVIITAWKINKNESG